MKYSRIKNIYNDITVKKCLSWLLGVWVVFTFLICFSYVYSRKTAEDFLGNSQKYLELSESGVEFLPLYEDTRLCWRFRFNLKEATDECYIYIIIRRYSRNTSNQFEEQIDENGKIYRENFGGAGARWRGHYVARMIML